MTGFGGDYIENKKDSESMQAAAKRKELELDTRVANALGFLAKILNEEGGYEERGAGLTAGTCALLGWGNTLSRLLRQLATNDSMLDISERSNLYIKMVSSDNSHPASFIWLGQLLSVCIPISHRSRCYSELSICIAGCTSESNHIP